MLFAFFAVGALRKRFERKGTEKIAQLLFAATALVILAQLAFALTSSAAVAIVALLAVFLIRMLMNPLWSIWLNQQITDSSVRATVLSMTGQADAVGQAAGGPVLGVIGNVWGIRAALTTGALVLTPALGLYARALRHGGAEPELEALPQLSRRGVVRPDVRRPEAAPDDVAIGRAGTGRRAARRSR